MRNFLSTNLCNKFQPTFDNRECDHYQYAETSNMEINGNECGYCKRPGAYRCVADVTRPVPLSHSSVSDFLTCHYLYYLKKILGIETRPAHFGNPLKAGKLWDSVKQKHLGERINLQEIINEYEIPPMVVAKVRALYHAYRELEIQVESGFELQAPVDLTYDIIIPPSAFIPSITIGKEAVNLWQERLGQSEDNRQWKFPLHVTGFYDRKYQNYFCEDKLSGRPEFYLDPFFVDSQMGTYFLADPNLEHVIMEVVQFPKQKEYKKKEETTDEIYKRIYDDVLSRPSNYFIGYNREKRMYGKKFFRGEFNLQAIKERYQQVVIEILAARWSGNFYKNFKSCNNVLPGIQCDFQTVCKTGCVSETIYKIRDRK